MRIIRLLLPGFLGVFLFCDLNRTADEDKTNPDINPDTGDQYSQARIDCVGRINAFRATENKPPLQRWKEAESCTDEQAESDSETGVAHGAFGECEERAQNECPGWRSVENVIQDCLLSMWNEGPGEPYSEHGHYINMSSTKYTKVACGFYETPAGRTWGIQNFR